MEEGATVLAAFTEKACQVDRRFAPNFELLRSPVGDRPRASDAGYQVGRCQEAAREPNARASKGDRSASRGVPRFKGAKQVNIEQFAEKYSVELQRDPLRASRYHGLAVCQRHARPQGIPRPNLRRFPGRQLGRMPSVRYPARMDEGEERLAGGRLQVETGRPHRRHALV